jgi:hypothetical protein
MKTVPNNGIEPTENNISYVPLPLRGEDRGEG